MPYKDPEKRREYMRNYIRTSEDKDVVKERNAKYYQKNKSELQAVAIVKACKRRSEYPEQIAAEKKKWASQNHEKLRRYGQKHRQKLKEKVIAYLGGCCVACGLEDDWPVFDAHHLDPSQKKFGIGAALGRRIWKEVTVELDKCVLLCANCHRKQRTGLIQLKSS